MAEKSNTHQLEVDILDVDANTEINLTKWWKQRVTTTTGPKGSAHPIRSIIDAADCRESIPCMCVHGFQRRLSFAVSHLVHTAANQSTSQWCFRLCLLLTLSFLSLFAFPERSNTEQSCTQPINDRCQHNQREPTQPTQQNQPNNHNNDTMSSKNLFIVAAKRTPFGAFGGSLKALTPTQLAVISSKAALASQPNLSPDLIDEVCVGNVIPSSDDGAYLARHVGLQSGASIGTPSLTINRLCGSGFESVIQGCNSILLGNAGMVLCGGTENMSMAPLQASGVAARWGVGLGKGLTLTDSLWNGLTDAHAGIPMGITAENLAEQYNITREVREDGP